jgi:hypothetical protein
MGLPTYRRPHEVWIDGIDTETGEALIARYAGDPSTSPYVKGSTLTDFLRNSVYALQESKFFRYGQVISDEDNPLTGLRIHVNRPELVPYFEELAERYLTPEGLPYRIVVG